MTKLEAATLILEKIKKENEDNLLMNVDVLEENDNNLRKYTKKTKYNNGRFIKFKYLSRKNIVKIINLFLIILKEKISEGDKVEFRGFGCFERRLRGQKKAVNPRTKEVINLEPYYIPFFKPSKEFKSFVKNYKNRK